MFLSPAGEYVPWFYCRNPCHTKTSAFCITYVITSNFEKFLIIESGIYPIMAEECLPNDEILDQSKLKAFADNKINVTQVLKFVL